MQDAVSNGYNYDIPDQKSADMIAETFKLISDGTRLRIICLLCHSEQCAGSIAEEVGMSAPAISHHLRVMKQSGLIKSRRDGKEILYSLADNAYSDIVHRTVDTVFGCKCSYCRNVKSGCGGSGCGE